LSAALGTLPTSAVARVDERATPRRITLCPVFPHDVKPFPHK
jgi:hypothetical protein